LLVRRAAGKVRERAVCTSRLFAIVNWTFFPAELREQVHAALVFKRLVPAANWLFFLQIVYSCPDPSYSFSQVEAINLSNSRLFCWFKIYQVILLAKEIGRCPT
jgi:hypothetical protein